MCGYKGCVAIISDAKGHCAKCKALQETAVVVGEQDGESASVSPTESFDPVAAKGKFEEHLAAGGGAASTTPAALVESSHTATSAAVELGLADEDDEEKQTDGVGGGAEPPTAPGASAEPPSGAPAAPAEPARCKKCCVAPAIVDTPYCEGCTKLLAAEREWVQKKKDDAWQVEFAREQAAKKRKLEALGDAIQAYYPATRRCTECALARKQKLVPYCDEHQGAINAAAEKQLARR
jgi:hypothetical protein